MTRPQLETRTDPCPAPPRYKRALLTFLGLLAPVYAQAGLETQPRLVLRGVGQPAT